MNTFIPTTGTEEEWNVAFYRLEDYFRALRIGNRVYQSQLILRILEKAAVRHSMNPEKNPTVLAMEEARAEMDHWFESVFGPNDRLESIGVISMLAADAPARWPTSFLSEHVPIECQQQMKDSHVRAGPDLQVSSMVPRPIDVTPVLDVFNFSEAFDKIRWSLAFVAVAVLAAMTFSFFLWNP